MAAITKSWTDITDAATDADSPVDQALVQGLRDNDVFLMEWIGASFRASAVQDHDHDGVNSKSVVLGDGVVATAKLADLAVTTAKLASGAVTQAKMASSAVGTSQLRLATGTGSFSVIDAQALVYTLPGGAHGFYPRIGVSGGSVQQSTFLALTNTTSENPYLTVETGVSGATGSWAQTYVTSSPPYDLGDGEIPLFVFARLDAAGNVKSTWVAPDPPWAYNGPTDIRPRYIDDTGRKFRRCMIDGRAELVEITQAVKNADMHLIPHPFVGADPLDRIVLLDPVGKITQDLCDLHDAGEHVAHLLVSGKIAISSDILTVRAPHGVLPVRAHWKITK